MLSTKWQWCCKIQAVINSDHWNIRSEVNSPCGTSRHYYNCLLHMYFKYDNISNLNSINFADNTLNIIYLSNKWAIGCAHPVKIMPNAKASHRESTAKKQDLAIELDMQQHPHAKLFMQSWTNALAQVFPEDIVSTDRQVNPIISVQWGICPYKLWVMQIMCTQFCTLLPSPTIKSFPLTFKGSLRTCPKIKYLWQNGWPN